jgi:hypothetical protein
MTNGDDALLDRVWIGVRAFGRRFTGAPASESRDSNVSQPMLSFAHDAEPGGGAPCRPYGDSSRAKT